MTDAERMAAIFDRLGKIDRDLATHSAHMSGELARVGDRLEGLDERIRTQNGRVTRAEHRLNELETQARIASVRDGDDKASREWWKEKSAAIVVGSLITTVAALIGYIF
jgi:maltodextrin utilization protein YvdJ